MYAWEGIQSVLDDMELHLDEEIDLEEMAKKAGLSPFYFQKLFSRLVKKPFREYIKLRRLAYGCQMLAEKPELRILDVAIASGFGSHEVFSRAFKDAYGLTPEQYRENPIFLNQFDKPDLTLNYVTADLGVPMISEGMILEMNWRELEKPISFMGVQAYVPIAGQMPLGEETGVDVPGEVWTRFHKEKVKFPRIPGGRELGLAYMGDAPEGSFTYFAGAEVAEGASLEGYEIQQIAPGRYLVCGFEAEDFMELVTVAINKAIKYSGRWMEEHGLTMDHYSPELYYDSSPEGSYMELWLPAVERTEDQESNPT